MKQIKHFFISSLLALSFLSAPAFAYTGAKEFVVYKGQTKIHIIDNFKVLVVLSITQNPYASPTIECGTFPFDEVNRTGKFGENTVYFGDKEYAYINGNRKFYVDNKLNLTLYKKVCNNFQISKPK